LNMALSCGKHWNWTKLTVWNGAATSNIIDHNVTFFIAISLS
jgi:hypothetical protein